MKTLITTVAAACFLALSMNVSAQATKTQPAQQNTAPKTKQEVKPVQQQEPSKKKPDAVKAPTATDKQTVSPAPVTTKTPAKRQLRKVSVKPLQKPVKETAPANRN